MSRAALLPLVLVLGCGEPAPEVPLAIRLPESSAELRRLLSAVARYELRAERDGRTIAQRSFPRGAPSVWLDGVPRGPRTVFALDGLVGDDVIARGRTCVLDYQGPSPPAPLYFAPTNFFARTHGRPAVTRDSAVVFTLDGGEVLVAGGAQGAQVVTSSEVFSPGPGTFAPAGDRVLLTPRRRAAIAAVPGVGTLVTGGLDAAGRAVERSEAYSNITGTFVLSSESPRLARVGHTAVTLPDGRVLVAGGAPDETQPLLGTTALVRLQGDGRGVAEDGPPLAVPRRDHAAVVAVGVPVVVGGFGPGGTPLDTLEALAPGATAFTTIATMRAARAEATATVLDDGSILIAGGIDASGAPRSDAELYNPITRTTAVHPMAVERRRHTATPIGGGRVLVIGGIGKDGRPSASVELFVPDVGFVTERSLVAPRAHHVAVALCDGTVLVVGGGEDAEIYTLPAR
jgi:hypothetical protein